MTYKVSNDLFLWNIKGLQRDYHPVTGEVPF